MVKLNTIYTRTGDDGTTGLVDGSRIAKHAARMDAIGAVDEANAALGLARRELSGAEADAVYRIQNDLFDLGADLATPAEADDDFAPSEMVLRVVDAQVEWLEAEIDALTAQLEPLTSFILPGGSEAAARLHIARTITRRAERTMTAMAETDAVNPAALRYINRLSDYLFVLGRAVNNGGKDDIKWVPGANR
jgi:cob(I)alamin adenosyltransferase